MSQTQQTQQKRDVLVLERDQLKARVHSLSEEIHMLNRELQRLALKEGKSKV